MLVFGIIEFMINHDSPANPFTSAPYDWASEADLPTEAEIYQFPFVNEEDDENDFPEIESDEDAEIVDITPTLAAKKRERNPLEDKRVQLALGTIGVAGMYFATNGGKTPVANLEAIWQMLT